MFIRKLSPVLRALAMEMAERQDKEANDPNRETPQKRLPWSWPFNRKDAPVDNG